ncbi:conserved protein, unknown function [Hepatocystis sp. ex Piliocolobus tephrosceles]|nr:conserved protein, unknown function [Hepatocystis sp. ex Piliocolobus tephrosceles]
MTGADVTIDNIAYAKIFMHALKNSYDDVCGILIGKCADEKKKKKKYTITNSIPLFHTHILSPFLSLAFSMVENYYKGNEERIIGYYHIHVDDSQNDNIKNIKVCESVAKKLVANYDDALICLVQISKLQTDRNNCLHIFTQNKTGEWQNVDVEISYENHNFLNVHISNNKYLNIHDFDDHLNCINCDFMNPNLFNNAT